MRDVEISVYVGVDWASQEHEVCVIDASGAKIDAFSCRHSGDGLSGLADRLVRHALDGEAGSVRVSIEVPHGAVVETLLERGFVVYSINPKQLDRFRDRHTMAGAKDDRLDAYVLADSLRTDGHLFRELEIDDSIVIELREWSRISDELGQEHVRLSNRIRQQLNRYFPAALQLTKSVGEPWFLELLNKTPTPEAAKKVKKASVEALLKRNRIRRVDAATVLRVLRQTPLTVAPGTIEAATAHIRLASDRLALVNTQVRDCKSHLDCLIDGLCAHDPNDNEPDSQESGPRDAEILRSLPGVGRIVLATLLAEASRPVRTRDYQALRSLSGVAPVTRASGKRRIVIMRKGCHQRLRNACYHWARVASQYDDTTKAAYAALRARGKTHGHALRCVADRLLRMACSMLRHGTLYEADRRNAA